MKDDEGMRDTTVMDVYALFLFFSYFTNRNSYTQEMEVVRQDDTHRVGKKREAAQIHYLIDTPPFFLHN